MCWAEMHTWQRLARQATCWKAEHTSQIYWKYHWIYLSYPFRGMSLKWGTDKLSTVGSVIHQQTSDCRDECIAAASQSSLCHERMRLSLMLYLVLWRKCEKCECIRREKEEDQLSRQRCCCIWMMQPQEMFLTTVTRVRLIEETPAWRIVLKTSGEIIIPRNVSIWPRKASINQKLKWDSLCDAKAWL